MSGNDDDSEHDKVPQPWWTRVYGGLFSEIGRACSHAVRKISDPNYLFVIVLFIPALVAMVAVSGVAADPARAFPVVLLIALLIVFLVTRLIQVSRPGRIEKKIRLVEARADNLGTIRRSIEGRTDAELEELRAALGLAPFPADRDSRPKRANWIFDQFPVSEVRPLSPALRRGPLLFGLVLFLISCGVLAFHWATSLPHPAETAIRSFYAGLNSGVLGDVAGWHNAWEQVSDEFRGNLIARFPGNYPDRFAELYRSSRFHRLLAVGLAEERDERLRIYTVIYSLEEGHPASKLYDKLSPQNSPKVASYYGQFPDAATVGSYVWTSLRDHYDAASDHPALSQLSEGELRRKVEEHVSSHVSMHELTSPRLLTVLGEQFKLKRSRDALAHPQDGMFHFYTMEVLYVRVHRQGDRWKIGKFVPQARYFVPMHVH